MHLMKYLRKNNKKIMAIVVVGLMVAFVAGDYLSGLRHRRAMGMSEVMGYHSHDRQITRADLADASQQMELLEMLGARQLLTQDIWSGQNVDLNAVLLAELLFPETRASAQLMPFIRQIVARQNYPISPAQLEAVYQGRLSSDFYWMLLTTEAQQAGVEVAQQDAANFLRQMSQGQYEQMMHFLLMQHNVTEEMVLDAMSNLLAVIQYAEMVGSAQNITSPELTHQAVMQNETMDVEYVQLAAALFADDLEDPDEQAIIEQFERYKDAFQGSVSQDNPFGFGYKLPDMVQLEYIFFEMDAVREVVEQPTSEQMEQYYQTNREQFSVEEPLDPDDPNSPTTQRIRSYPEVAGEVRRRMTETRKENTAQSFLQKIRDRAQQGLLEDSQARPASFETVADELSSDLGMRFYAGKTGWLSATDINEDMLLASMAVQQQGQMPIGLVQKAFSVDQLEYSPPRPGDEKISLYQSFGPVRDQMDSMMGLMRVVDVKAAGAPESVDESFSKQGPAIGQIFFNRVHSVREVVIEDLKHAAAMEMLGQLADELIELAENSDWQAALEQFNQAHEVNLTTESQTNLNRFSEAAFRNIKIQNQNQPHAEAFLAQARRQMLWRNQLYSLIEPEQSTPASLPVVMESKTQRSYYVIKDLELDRLTEGQYEQLRPIQAYQLQRANAQAAAVVHVNPVNIEQRMGFRPARAVEDDSAEADQI